MVVLIGVGDREKETCVLMLVPLWEDNSGVIICNKKHKEFYDKIIEFYLENRDHIVNLQDIEYDQL